MPDSSDFGFTVVKEQNKAGIIGAKKDRSLGRAGLIRTPHGDIATPAFIPVGTKATVKGLLPETVESIGGQAILANAYHLFLQPGSDVVDAGGGLSEFMNWQGPTFTDSGGFQVMSLGAGMRKVIAMETEGKSAKEVHAKKKDRLAKVDEDGVTFKSFLNGQMHRFTPEISMRVQHELGADIMFAFDELTTLFNSYQYQEASVERTARWAVRCLDAHAQLTLERAHRPYQALFGVVQGAQYERLRRRAAAGLAQMSGVEYQQQTFDGFGLGGAIEKSALGRIVSWMTDELPDNKPRHLLGISEPDDLILGVAAGADTFDCVAPSRQARGGTMYTKDGRLNAKGAFNRRRFEPLEPGCACYTCQNYDAAYLHHLFKAKEMLGSTLATIHNEHFILRLVEEARQAIIDDRYLEFAEDTLGRYYGSEYAAQVLSQLAA